MIRDVTVALSKINILNDKHFFLRRWCHRMKIRNFFKPESLFSSFNYNSHKHSASKASRLMSFKLSSKGFQRHKSFDAISYPNTITSLGHQQSLHVDDPRIFTALSSDATSKRRRHRRGRKKRWLIDQSHYLIMIPLVFGEMEKKRALRGSEARGWRCFRIIYHVVADA